MEPGKHRQNVVASCWQGQLLPGTVSPVLPSPVSPFLPCPISLVLPSPVYLFLPSPMSPVLPSPMSPVLPSPMPPVLPSLVSPFLPCPVSPFLPCPVSPFLASPVSPVLPSPVSPLLPCPISPVLPHPLSLFLPCHHVPSAAQSCVPVPPLSHVPIPALFCIPIAVCPVPCPHRWGTPAALATVLTLLGPLLKVLPRVTGWAGCVGGTLHPPVHPPRAHHADPHSLSPAPPRERHGDRALRWAAPHLAPSPGAGPQTLPGSQQQVRVVLGRGPCQGSPQQSPIPGGTGWGWSSHCRAAGAESWRCTKPENTKKRRNRIRASSRAAALPPFLLSSFQRSEMVSARAPLPHAEHHRALGEVARPVPLPLARCTPPRRPRPRLLPTSAAPTGAGGSAPGWGSVLREAAPQ